MTEPKPTMTLAARFRRWWRKRRNPYPELEKLELDGKTWNVIRDPNCPEGTAYLLSDDFVEKLNEQTLLASPQAWAFMDGAKGELATRYDATLLNYYPLTESSKARVAKITDVTNS